MSYYEKGTLVIDIVDTKNRELSWQGLGPKTLGNKTGEKKLQVVDDIVRRILANFPPQQ
jgi:hypothetical protein